MKWMIILAAVGAGGLALQVLIWERRGGPRPPAALARLALAVLTVVVGSAAVYAAHLLGIFSIPLVAIGFVTLGIAGRWLILATRGRRQRAADARAAARPPSSRTRLLEIAAWPVFIALFTLVVVVGLVVGMLVGPH